MIIESALKTFYDSDLGTMIQAIERNIAASKLLESRIMKIKDIYSSGVRSMKEIADTLQKNDSSDLKQIQSNIAAQTLKVENFLSTAVLESEEVIRDIQSSLDEQKQLLAFTAQQQEEGLQRSLVLAQVISKTAVDCFDDLHNRSTKLTTILDESQTKKSYQLATFGKNFQEESAREEKLALEQIAAVLGTLTSKKLLKKHSTKINFLYEWIIVEGRRRNSGRTKLN